MLPERVWFDADAGHWEECQEGYSTNCVEYVRADMVAAQAGRYDLIALKRCADDAVDVAQDVKPLFEGEAINWGDLKCVGAEWCIDADNSTGHRVWIEEVDPAAYRLRDFIREHLTEHGFSDVDVMLEW